MTLHEWPLREAMIAHGPAHPLDLARHLARHRGAAVLRGAAADRAADRPGGRAHDRLPRRPGGREPDHRAECGARELREAETALHDLEVRLTAALRQKERLAGLGAAVAKISHDLRNLLTTAQLLADRIEASADPAVRRTAPKLVGSLSRAISLCERTLAFGRAEELPPEPAVLRAGAAGRGGARERARGGRGGLRRLRRRGARRG